MLLPTNMHVQLYGRAIFYNIQQFTLIRLDKLKLVLTKTKKLSVLLRDMQIRWVQFLLNGTMLIATCSLLSVVHF